MINSPESNGLKSIDKANDVYEATGLWWAGTIDRTPELNFPLTAPIADLTELDFIMESKNRQRALIEEEVRPLLGEFASNLTLLLKEQRLPYSLSITTHPDLIINMAATLSGMPRDLLGILPMAKSRIRSGGVLLVNIPDPTVDLGYIQAWPSQSTQLHLA